MSRNIPRRNVASTIFDTVIYKLHPGHSSFIQRYMYQYGRAAGQSYVYLNKHTPKMPYWCKMRDPSNRIKNMQEDKKPADNHRSNRLNEKIHISKLKKSREIGTMLYWDMHDIISDTKNHLSYNPRPLGYAGSKYYAKRTQTHDPSILLMSMGKGTPFYLFAEAFETSGNYIYRHGPKRGYKPAICDCRALSRRGKRLLRENYDAEDLSRFD